MRIPYDFAGVYDFIRKFRKTVHRLIQESFTPQQARWRDEHHPDAEAWTKAGATGMLLPDLPREYGRGGGSFAHEAVVWEELARAGLHIGSRVQSIVARYLHSYGSAEPKHNWLPRMARDEVVGAVAMTEPVAGTRVRTRS